MNFVLEEFGCKRNTTIDEFKCNLKVLNFYQVDRMSTCEKHCESKGCSSFIYDGDIKQRNKYCMMYLSKCHLLIKQDFTTYCEILSK